MRKLALVLVAVFAAWNARALEWRQAWEALHGRTPAEDGAGLDTPGHTVPLGLPGAPKMGVGVFRVTGHGAAPSDVDSPAQGRLMAVGAAQLDALKKLSELVQGGTVTADSESGAFVQSRYAVEQRTSAFLRGVRVLETRHLPDGTAEVDAELVLEGAETEPDFSRADGYRIRPAAEPLRGVVASASRGEELTAALEPLPDVPPAPASAHPPVNVIPGSAGVIEPEPPAMPAAEPLPPTRRGKSAKGPFTDLVLDARGLGARPALEPRVLTDGNRQLYPFRGGVLERFAPPKDAELRYARSLEEARSLPGFGDNPLIIMADGVLGAEKTDLFLGARDALKLKPLLDSRLARGEGYVVIVID